MGKIIRRFGRFLKSGNGHFGFLVPDAIAGPVTYLSDNLLNLPNLRIIYSPLRIVEKGNCS